MAGNGTEGYDGDGGPATSAKLSNPEDVAVDGAGHLYIADFYNNRIRKVEAGTGIITTVAGNGMLGYSGDGGAAAGAKINCSRGVAVDSDGNLYIADSYNNRVRKVEAGTGIITTVAGNGSQGYDGDGGAPTSAQLHLPYRVAVDGAGHLYIADCANSRIRKVFCDAVAPTWSAGYPRTGTVSDTAAQVLVKANENGTAYFVCLPSGAEAPGALQVKAGQDAVGTPVAANRKGSVALTADHEASLSVTSLTNGTYRIYVAAEDGFANLQAEPARVTVTNDSAPEFDSGYPRTANVKNTSLDLLLRTDRAATVYYKVFAQGVAPPTSAELKSTGTPVIIAEKFVAIWEGSGSGAGQFNMPFGIAADAEDNVYVADTMNHRIQKFDRDGDFIVQWGSQGSGDGEFNRPFGVAVDRSGHIYVTDASNNRIQKFDSGGNYLVQWGGAGSGNGQFNSPIGIAVDSDGHVYVTDSNNKRVQKFDSSGNYLTQWGTEGTDNGQFKGPMGIVADENGHVYVSDELNHRVQKFDKDGNFLLKWGRADCQQGSGDGEFYWPDGMAVDSDGYIYVIESGNNRVQKFDTSGNFIAKWGGYGSGAGQFSHPYGIAAGKVGIYIADTGNNRVQQYAFMETASVTQGLMDGQAFDIYAVAESRGYLHPAPVKVTVAMDTAPVFDGGYPKTANVQTASLDLLLKLDEAGTAYYKVYDVGMGNPSSAELKASGTPLTVAGTGEVSVAITGGLAEGQTYDIFVAAENANGSLQVVPAKVMVTMAGTASGAYIASAVPEVLTEGLANDGSLDPNTVVITIAGGTLAADITKGDVTAENLPAGLDYTVIRTDGTHLTIAVTGQAARHTDVDSVSGLTFTIVKAKVSGAVGSLISPNISIQFKGAAAPTNPVADDDSDTFGWTYTPGYETLADYEYSVNGGLTWNDCTANPQPVGNDHYAAGTVQVRVKGDGATGRPSGEILASDGAFTKIPVFDSGYPKADHVTDTTVDLSAKMDEGGNVYYVICGPGGDAPSAAAVKSGGTPMAVTGRTYAAQWGTSGSGNGQFNTPNMVAVDRDGNIYVADDGNARVQKFDANGNWLLQFGSRGSNDGQFQNVNGVAVDGAGNVYVTDWSLNRVQKFDSNGTFLTKWGGSGTGNGQFNRPYGVAVDGAGNVYVADSQNRRIQKFNSSGTYSTQWGTLGGGDGQFNQPVGVAVDGAGNVYVTDCNNHFVQKFNSSGGFLARWGVISGGSGDGQFNKPQGIAVDQNGHFYVADMNNQRIQEFDGNGTFICKWGGAGSSDGQFNEPYGVAVDSEGNVYVSDRPNKRIEKFSPVHTAHITGLSPGQSYDIYVVAENTGGRLQPSPTKVMVTMGVAVHFPDAGLEAAVRGAINKPAGNIYQTDLDALTALDASGRNITNLSGLEHCTVLTELNLSDNQISDLSVLAGLTALFSVNLQHNRIKDITPLVENAGLGAGDTADITYNHLDLGAGSPDLTAIQVLQGRGVDVNFEPQEPVYTLTVNIDGPGSVTREPDRTAFANGESVTLTAVPDNRCCFKGWSGALTGTANPATLVMDGDKTVTAQFALIPAAPTGPIVDDVDDTFGWTNVPDYPDIQDYEYSGDGGATWSDCTAHPQPVGNRNFAAGAVQVRVKADSVTGRPSGEILASDRAFTRIPVFDSGYPKTSNVTDTALELSAMMDEAGTAYYKVYSHGADAPSAAAVKSSGIPLAAGRVYAGQWGGSGSGNGQFNAPHMVAVDRDGNIYVADDGNARVQKFDSSGNWLARFGSAGSGDGQFQNVNGVAVDSAGNVYVTDWTLNRVQKFDSSGNFLAKWGSGGTGNGQFSYPYGVAVDAAGNVYVADSHNNRIQKFDSNGTFLAKWGSNGTGNGQFKLPVGVAVDGAGNVYVADCDNHRVQKFNSSGTFQAKWGGTSSGSGDGRFNKPQGIAADQNGHVYVGDMRNNRVQEFTGNGTFVSKWGSAGSGDGQFNEPYGVAVDSAGNVYVSDRLNKRIEKFSSLYRANITGLLAGQAYDIYVVAENTGGCLQPSPTKVEVTMATVVRFPDAGLEAAVREAISKPAGNIYQTDLDALTALNASGRNIVNLSGLEHCTALTELDLSNNQISDLSALAGLTALHDVYLQHNLIEDLVALVANTGLGDGDTVNVTHNHLDIVSGSPDLGAIQVLQGRGVDVSYDPQEQIYTLTVNIAGPGGVTRNPDRTAFATGESVTLTAVPDAGCYFEGWSGALTGRTNPATLFMDGDKTVTTQFAPVPAAPTDPAVDDLDNTFGWTNVLDYPDIEDYEYSVNGGATWSDCTANPLHLGNRNYAAGAVQVRVKGDSVAGRPSGTILASGQAFTKAPVLDSGYPKAANVMETTLDLTVKIDEAGTAYYKVYSHGTDAPSAAELKTGGTPVAVSTAYVAQWGTSGSGDGQFDTPNMVALDKDGNIYVADDGNGRVQKFDGNGNWLLQFGGPGSNDGQFQNVSGVAVDADGNVYVTDWSLNRVQKFHSSGTFLIKWGGSGSGDGQFSYPYGVAVDAAGNVYVVDSHNNRIQKFNSSGTFLAKWGGSGYSNGQFSLPVGVAVDDAGNVYVVDNSNKRVQKFDGSGNFLAKWGNLGSGDGQFNSPEGIAVDHCGNVYVADGNNKRVQKFNSSGTFISKWGSSGSGDGQFSYPYGVAIDSAGNIYVSDRPNKRIEKFSYQATTNITDLGAGQAYDIYVVAESSSGGLEDAPSKLEVTMGGTIDNGGINYESENWAITPGMAVYDNHLYTAWVENTNGHTQIRVKKYDGADWSPADSGSLNMDSGKNAYNPALREFKGSLYLAWYEDPGTNKIYQVYIREYAGGTSWDEGVKLSYSDYKAFNIKLKVYDNTLYAVWVENNGTRNQIRVKMTSNGGTWETADDNNTLNYNPADHVTIPSAEVYDDALYVAWSEKGKIRLRKYDGSWSGADDGSLNYDDSKTAHVPILLNNGSLYLIWLEQNASDIYQVRAQKYNGTSWAPAGSDSLNDDESQGASMLNGTVYHGTLYAAWTENGKVRIKTYDEDEETWVPLGDGNINYDASKASSGLTFMEYQGKLYISWKESNGTAEQIRVKVH
ncbi:6-bladed beta-propeller [Candidatus Formimonas warabiya]|uniref:6-bladed beta-propeller n=1 Tax=Formimonas warabiya TaxID=1761012 RepID=UPI001F4301E7|nr:6-bladed beta-propeller [Candidatus Formimonas warabiya]